MISIHAFRRECDVYPTDVPRLVYKFQSTHSAGNATTKIAVTEFYFNPRIPQGMRPNSRWKIRLLILIHAFRRECDKPMNNFPSEVFQSTHSAGNATIHGGLQSPTLISIHAFRRECDGCHPLTDVRLFQSTHSAGNATSRPYCIFDR